MEKQDLQELALRLGAFVEMLEKQATSVADNMAQSGQTMTRSARDIAGQVQQLSQSVVSTVRIESRGAVEAGAREGIAPALEKMHKTIQALQSSSQNLHAQTKALKGAQRSTVWLASMALVLASLLAAGGSSYLVWKNQQELKRTAFPRDLLDATRSGAITRCGDNLCLRVGNNPEQYSKNRDYVIVR